jgi:hypothetical protein
MRRESGHLLKLGALTVAVLMAAVAVWAYGGSSDSAGGGSGGRQPSQGLADLSLRGAAKTAGDGSPPGGRHTARRGAPHTKEAISRQVSAISPVISGPVPSGGPSFPQEVPPHTVKMSPVKTSPVRRERRRSTTHPRTLPPRRAPKPRGGPADPVPAPSPAPEQAPSTGTPSEGAPSNPGATPTDPGMTPTDPGTTPAPVPAADPDAGLDDTPAGGLDQTDLGGPIDETPDAGAPAPAPPGGTG